MAATSVPDRGPLIIAVCSVLISLTVLAIALRFLSRRLAKAGFWWDDWLSLLTLVRNRFVMLRNGMPEDAC